MDTSFCLETAHVLDFNFSAEPPLARLGVAQIQKLLNVSDISIS